jgi:hypothetical protein
MPRRDPGGVWYHGTGLASALSLLNGAELRLEIALEQKIDGPPGCYLADDPDAAVFVAVRRAPGAVLRYTLSAAATSTLLARGATIAPIPRGAFPTAFPGRQFVVLPALFAQFNRLRRIGAVLVTPYGFR